MALDARTRSSLYGKFAELLGDHDANALMSEFPSVEADELVTREHLRAELALIRGEVAGMRAELRDELRGGIASLRVEMVDRFQRQTTWLAGTVLASSAVVIAAIPLLG